MRMFCFVIWRYNPLKNTTTVFVKLTKEKVTPERVNLPELIVA